MADLLSFDRQGLELLRWSEACYYLIWFWLLIFSIEKSFVSNFLALCTSNMTLEAVTRPYSDSGVLILF